MASRQRLKLHKSHIESIAACPADINSLETEHQLRPMHAAGQQLGRSCPATAHASGQKPHKIWKAAATHANRQTAAVPPLLRLDRSWTEAGQKLDKQVWVSFRSCLHPVWLALAPWLALERTGRFLACCAAPESEREDQQQHHWQGKDSTHNQLHRHWVSEGGHGGVGGQTLGHQTLQLRVQGGCLAQERLGPCSIHHMCLPQASCLLLCL
mmetsp:Transcript_4546/g.7755  ORF Transcript_4546/g.7755 Transcript_4546/m.7755 type:complete len:211 (-) Transcript_4546:555-1187(-)